MIQRSASISRRCCDADIGLFNVTQGKNFDRSGSIGPWPVPFVEEAQLADISLTTRGNGDLRRSNHAGRMFFSFRWIINGISTFTTPALGVVILNGTPTCAGARLDPPVWLKSGDLVETEDVGILPNGVDEAIVQ